MGIKVFSVSEMVAAEKAADSTGHSYADMMELAGKGTAEAIQQRIEVKNKSILVLVGPGNNGGDGLVAGRYLAQAGADVAFYLSKPRDPTADPNYAKILEMGLFTVEAGLDQRFRVLRTRLAITDILIDALLGTGVSRPIGGELARLMQQVQAGIEERGARSEEREVRIEERGVRDEEREAESKTPFPLLPSLFPLRPSLFPLLPSSPPPFIVAVDCPSGLNCDTGTLDPAAFPAQLTVTFAGAKRGHFLFPGAAACGELVVTDIGISADLPEVKNVQVEVATADLARALLPVRPSDGHKGTFGKALIAAGSSQYWGAPLLAGRAAYRAGAGLVALAVPSAIRATIAGQLPEATYPPVPDAETLGEASARMVQETPAQALLVGPGLGDAKVFLETLLASETLPPLVVDADGLNILAGWPDWPKRLPPNTILTPHPGEMKRLVGGVTAEGAKDAEGKEMNQGQVATAAPLTPAPPHPLISSSRIELAQQKAQEWGHVVVLKGANTVVAAADGRCTILPFANPALAVAGSGDVLAGIIVGLRAQGMAAYEAAVLGGYLHGAAGAYFPGDRGLLAGEIADLISIVQQNLLPQPRATD